MISKPAVPRPTPYLPLPEPFERIKPLDKNTIVTWWQLELVLRMIQELQNEQRTT